MHTDTAGATIFYTSGSTNTIPAPTHTGSTPGSGTSIYMGPISVAAGSVKHFKALAYYANMVDSRVTYHFADNTFRDPGGGGMQPASSSSPTPGPLGPMPASPMPQVFYNVYDGWNLIAEYSSGVLVASTKYLPGIKNLTTNQYYYQDGLGSTSHLSDNQGHLLEWYRYDLHGTPIFLNAANASLPASAYGNRFLFTGQQWYAELGLYDLRNRFYSPDIGRFVQADPIGFAGDPTSLYRYVGNNPSNRTDLRGLTTDTSSTTKKPEQSGGGPGGLGPVGPGEWGTVGGDSEDPRSIYVNPSGKSAAVSPLGSASAPGLGGPQGLPGAGPMLGSQLGSGGFGAPGGDTSGYSLAPGNGGRGAPGATWGGGGGAPRGAPMGASPGSPRGARNGGPPGRRVGDVYDFSVINPQLVKWGKAHKAETESEYRFILTIYYGAPVAGAGAAGAGAPALAAGARAVGTAAMTYALTHPEQTQQFLKEASNAGPYIGDTSAPTTYAGMLGFGLNKVTGVGLPDPDKP